MIKALQYYDETVLTFIQGLNHPVLDPVMVFFSKICDLGMIWVLIALILLSFKKHRKTGLFVLIALLISSIIGEGILKNWIQRARPFTAEDLLLIAPPSSFSFPSGHAMSSFAACGVLAHFLIKYKWSFYILGTLIAFSRLYLFVHYPLDVVCGILFGLLVGWGVIQIGTTHFEKRDKV